MQGHRAPQDGRPRLGPGDRSGADDRLPMLGIFDVLRTAKRNSNVQGHRAPQDGRPRLGPGDRSGADDRHCDM